MAKTFAEKSLEQKRSSMLPALSRPAGVHMPLASIAAAAKHMRIRPEQTRVGAAATSAADKEMRVARNLSALRTDSPEISKRFQAMLERVGTG